jgi:hypothetical protein
LYQSVKGQARSLEVLDEDADALQGGQVEVHDGELVLGEAGVLGSLHGLREVAAGHDNVPVAGLSKRNGGVQAQSRGGASDDGDLLVPNPLRDGDLLDRRASDILHDSGESASGLASNGDIELLAGERRGSKSQSLKRSSN